jgi:uncharacterized protein (UPF0332 family)
MEVIDKVKIYWEKSVENRQVSDHAFTNQQFNASASRYYYALYHGFWSLFEKNGIGVPKDVIVGERLIPNRYKSWPKEALRDKAVEIWTRADINLERFLNYSKRLREKGDYDDVSVEERELKSLRTDADKIFEELNKQING